MIPLFMPNRKSVQPPALYPTVGHVGVHEAEKSGIVGRFQQVRHFVKSTYSRHSGGFLARSLFGRMFATPTRSSPTFRLHLRDDSLDEELFEGAKRAALPDVCRRPSRFGR
jgi:hypothetical protein